MKQLFSYVVLIILIVTAFGLERQETKSSIIPPKLSEQVPKQKPTPNNNAVPPSLIPRVTRIIDGDTIVITRNGIQEKIRLIGVNTPESVDPRRKVECFGKEASAFTTTLLLNKEVYLESDPSQTDRDRYGRLLRFIFLPDGTLVNREIIAKGYGHEYTYRTPHKYHDDFRLAQQEAERKKLGLWADDVCNKNSPGEAAVN